MKERYVSYDVFHTIQSAYNKLVEVNEEEKIISHNIVYAEGKVYLTIISEKDEEE